MKCVSRAYALSCLVGFMWASAQTAPPSQAEQNSVALSNVQSGRFETRDLYTIIRSHLVDSRADIERSIPSIGDPVLKAHAAAAALRLGSSDDAYWNLVVQYARPALKSDEPYPNKIDASGQVLGEPSTAFLSWAGKEHLTPSEAYERATEDPLRVSLLAESRDKRAVPFLRLALQSPNFMMDIVAAEGLAAMEDLPSIPLIVRRISEVPTAAKGPLARALLFYDEPAAHEQAGKFLPAATVAGIVKSVRDAGKDVFVP